MKDQIEKLKAELREFIELLKEETKWKVSLRKGGVFICAADKVGLAMDVCSIYQCSRTNQRATFIARSRNISPTLAECLLVAVEALEDIEHGDTHCHAEHDERAADALMQILTIWEASK
jgi:hypothetical protein